MQHELYRKIFMNITVGFAYLKMHFSSKGTPIDYEFIDVNDFFGQVVGFDADKLKCKKITEVVQYFNVDDFKWNDAFNDLPKVKEGLTYTIYSAAQNRYYVLNAFAVSKKHFVIVLNDITDIQGKFQTDDMRIRLIIDAISEGIICIDENGTCVFCNTKALRILDLSLEETLGRNIRDVVRNEKNELRFTPELHFNDIINEVSQKIYWIKNNVYLHFSAKNQYHNGRRIGTVLTFYDINYEVKMQSKLEDKLEENRLLLRNLPGMVYKATLSREEPLKYVSLGSLDLTGYLPKSFLGKKEITLDAITSNNHKDHIKYLWKDAIETNTIFKEEYKIISSDGSEHWVLETARPITDEFGKVIFMEGVIINIDNLKKKQEEIEYLSCHDQLTGLYNRQYFENIKTKYLNEHFFPLSIMMIDINGLRCINESIGVNEGDRVIQVASRIIESCLSTEDIGARFSGSTFIVLMPRKTNKEANEVFNKIKSVCIKYNENVTPSVFHINLAIGYATLDSIEQNYKEVLKQAEDAMYKNKLLDTSSTHSSVISSITSAMFERSQYTEMHSYRIKDLAKQFGLLLGFTPEKLDELLLLATLHDIGKIAISDSILDKPGPLTKEEWIEMKKHPMAGYRIARASPMLKPIANYILCHHERWDGSGYPRGLKGLEIPLLSRVISVVDAFDAMTEDRPYRKKRSIKEALKEIVDNSGTQFDPKLANIFVKMIAREYNYDIEE